MRLKLQLPAKAGRFHIFECEAVRLVTLPDEEFQDFLNGPHQDGRWAAEPFYADEHGRRTTRASSFWERGIKTEFLPMMGETLCLLARSKSGG